MGARVFVKTIFPALFQRSAFSVQRSAFSVQRSAFSVQRSAFSVQPSAFSVQRSAFSVQRSAFSVQPSAFSLYLYLYLYFSHPHNQPGREKALGDGEHVGYLTDPELVPAVEVVETDTAGENLDP